MGRQSCRFGNSGIHHRRSEIAGFNRKVASKGATFRLRFPFGTSTPLRYSLHMPSGRKPTDKTLFHAYVPTRDVNSLELRVCSAMDGPIEVTLDGRVIFIEAPSTSHGGVHFYRQIFELLPAGKSFVINVRHPQSSAEDQVETSTLKAPTGRCKLKIGILADLHLPESRLDLDRYTPGTRRFGGLANELGSKYIKRLEGLGADIIVLPGDVVDPCNRKTLSLLKTILNSVNIPCYPIIGNHEPWSKNGESLFREMLGLPSHGYYSVCHGDCRLLMLDTPEPGALADDSAQLRWLERQLEAAPQNVDLLVFSHFSVLLHPCVQGHRNDGYQLLDNHKRILNVLERYPNVRLFAAGHKNIPSAVLKKGIVHTLSPQLIQFPSGYDMLSMYDGGILRTTYEIDEQHYLEFTKAGYVHNWQERYGAEEGRNFSIDFNPGFSR